MRIFISSTSVEGKQILNNPTAFDTEAHDECSALITEVSNILNISVSELIQNVAANTTLEVKIVKFDNNYFFKYNVTAFDSAVKCYVNKTETEIKVTDDFEVVII